jgi:hypothetical protein
MRLDSKYQGTAGKVNASGHEDKHKACENSAVVHTCELHAKSVAGSSVLSLTPGVAQTVDGSHIYQGLMRPYGRL